MSLTTKLDITRKRGDTYPIKLLITADSEPLDITGATFKLTVDTLQSPPDATTKLFDVSGVITDAAGGAFEFRPSAENMDLDPATYYYDAQMTDADTFITTVAKGKFKIEQDITK